MEAAIHNMLDAVRLLFEFNANPNVVNKNGTTALYGAARKGHAAMMRLLVEHGAGLNVQAVNGYTALHAAAENGHIECVHILLDAGAEIDLVNKKGRTPAKLALRQRHSPTLGLLLRYGADAHLAAVLADKTNPSEEEKKDFRAILGALKQQPSFIHLLADHGGICQKDLLDFQMSFNGCTHVLRALRQVGCDAWCSAGRGTGFSTTMVVGFSKIGAARDNHKPQTTTTQPRKRAGHSTLHTTIQPQPQTTQPQKWDIFDLNSADYKTRMRTAALHLAHPPTQCTP
jgi:hypothetical protein